MRTLLPSGVRSTLPTLLLLLLFNPISAQLHHNFQEALSHFSFVEMPDGNYFTAGTVYNNSNNNPTDILVAYLDPSGQILWSKRIDNGREERCFNVNKGIGDEAIITGFVQLDQNLETFLMGFDVSGNLLFNHNYDLVATANCPNGLAFSTGTHVIANEEGGDMGYTLTGFGFRDFPITPASEKEIFVLRLRQNGLIDWQFHMNTPNNGGPEDWDMGEHILRIPGGYYITGSSNLISNPGGFLQQATLSLRIDDGGFGAWHNSYITANTGPDRQPGACAIFYDNPANPIIPDPTILTLSNSTDSHLFQITEIDPNTGAVLGPITHEYWPNTFFGVGSTMFLDDSQLNLVVGGYALSAILPVQDPTGATLTTFGNSPPFLVEIDLTTWNQNRGEYYGIPTVNAGWAITGDWFTTLPTPMVHTPEMALLNQSGQQYSFLAYRDQYGNGEFDLEYTQVPTSLAGPCGNEPFEVVYQTRPPEVNVDWARGCEAIYFTFDPFIEDPCPVSSECTPSFDWPIVDNGFIDNSVGNDVFVDAKYEYVTGYFTSLITLNGQSLAGSAVSNMFAAMIDADGNVIWLAGTDGVPGMGSGSATGKGIVSDGAGGTYVIGDFEGIVQFGPSIVLTSAGQRDIFVARIDECGEFTWVHRYGGTGNDLGNDISIDPDGDLYLVGNTNGTFTDNLQTVTSAGVNDGWIARADQAGGNFVWAWRVGGTGNDVAEDVVFDPNTNEVFAIGAHNGTGTFSTGGSSTAIPVASGGGSADVWVGRWSAGGTNTWFSTMGGAGIEWGNGIDVGPSGVYITGTLGSNTVLFNSTAGCPLFPPLAFTIGGLTDMFVGRLGLNGCPTNNFQAISGPGIDFGSSISHTGVAGEAYATGATWSASVPGLTGINGNPGTYDFMAIHCTGMNTGTGAAFSGELKGDVNDDLGWSVDARRANPGSTSHAYFTGSFMGTINFPVVRTGLPANPNFFLSRIRNSGFMFKTAEIPLDPEAEYGIQAFPNPSTGNVRIQLNFDPEQLQSMELYSVQGKRIKVDVVGEAEVRLDLSAYPDGIYFVHVLLKNGEQLTSKLILSK